ncbi:MAG: LTA synthase family protein, partial [Nitrospiraceae bacterium]
MKVSAEGSGWSFRRTLVFWWILFLVIQQAERLFLLPETLSIEVPAAGVLAKTLLIGLRADLITATLGAVIATILAGAIGAVLAVIQTWRGLSQQAGTPYRFGLMAASGLIGLLFLILLTVDMGYYRYNQQHLDFVFFEYLDDLWRTVQAGLPSAQAAQQTEAELHEGGKWGLRLLGFLLAEGAAVSAWWLCFRRVVEPMLNRWGAVSAYRTNTMLVLGLLAGAMGFHHQGPYAIRIADINSTAYYTLAQNPILYASEALRAVVDSRLKGAQHWAQAPGMDALPLEEAVRAAQEALGRGESFSYPSYPLVREAASSTGVRLARPANVLLIFIEGLDRRYLGRTIGGIRVTPFLDRLREDSVFVEHFFTNGVQTSRGLFASFCSYYPRQGTSAMKTRYTHDYLCLPSLLRRGGYWTEMVISQHQDLNRLQLFMARNGLHQLLDESDFPTGAERLGLGITDGALFDLLGERIEALQRSGQPFFLSTLTLGMHHPFTVPQTHQEVRALQSEPDGYVRALRYLDVEFERVFARLRRAGSLKNTVVFILGDHGRHEPVGRTEVEKQAGHFTAPLFIWMDDSLRTPQTYRPRTVSGVASQVDLAPTILAMNGLTPRVSPFLGRDLSCVLIRDCLQDNVAFLSSVYDDLIGLADRDGLLLYSLRTETLYQTDLNLEDPPVSR